MGSQAICICAEMEEDAVLLFLVDGRRRRVGEVVQVLRACRSANINSSVQGYRETRSNSSREWLAGWMGCSRGAVDQVCQSVSQSSVSQSAVERLVG